MILNTTKYAKSTTISQIHFYNQTNSLPKTNPTFCNDIKITKKLNKNMQDYILRGASTTQTPL